MTWVDPDWACEPEAVVCPPTIEVEVTEPTVLGYLYGPDGEPIATLLDRRIVPFGFR